MFEALVLPLRRLRRQPAFAITAIATLALGIGASTGIFAALHAVLLRPLPYASPHDLYTLRTGMTDGRFTSGLVGTLELSRLKESTDRVMAVAAVSRLDTTILRDAAATQVLSYGVSPGYFQMFGLPMAAGRAFSEVEHTRGYAGAVILSHRLWQRLFRGDPTIVGTKINLAVGPVTVIGVAHPAFDEPRNTDIWFAAWFPPGIGHSYEGYMRLRPGTTLDAVRGPMAAVMRQLGIEFPDQDNGRIFVVRPMLDAVVGDLGPVLLIVFGATLLLLVLAAANVTNLMLARGTGRAREVAVRAALGASQARLVRELVAESLVLTTIGGAVGVALAFYAIEVLSRIGMASLPRLAGPVFDPRVLLFAIVVMIVTGVLVAIAPAISLQATDIRSLVAADARTTMGHRTTHRLLGGMIVAEIAVAIALVSGAGRLVQGFADLLTVDSGFTSEDRLIVDVSLPWNPWKEGARFEAFEAALRDQVRPLGVTAVGVVSAVPLAHEWDTTNFIDFLDRPAPDEANRPNGRARQVSSDFFDVLGIRLTAGRQFAATDRIDTPAVIIVNREFVRRFIAPRNPIGERVTLLGFRTHMEGKVRVHEPTTIIGVVDNVRSASLGRPAEPTVYTSMQQWTMPKRWSVVLALNGEGRGEMPATATVTSMANSVGFGEGVVARAGSNAGDLDRLALGVRKVIQRIAPQVPVETERLSEIVSASVSRQRLGMILMIVFGLTALALAIVGVFGVIAYVVGQRLREMALRLALGGSTASVFWLVVRHGARLAVWGSISGTLFAWWTGRLMTRFAGASAHESTVIGAATATVCVVALAATSIVALRAARVDPARVLHTAD